MFRNNTIGNNNINDGIKLAERYFSHDSKLIQLICEKTDWKYNTPKMPKLREMLLAKIDTINIYTYRPKWRWSKAISYYQNGAIYYNIYKLDSLTVQEIAANLCHEYCHALGFGHGNNFKTQDKVNFSIPFFVSESILKGLSI